LNSFNSSRNSCYFYYASGGFILFDCNVLVLEIILAGFGLQYSVVTTQAYHLRT